MKVAIVGCGPAGLLAAHAAVLADCQPIIYANRVEPSPNARGVYLHSPIPEITGRSPDGVIQFRRVGRREGYAAKVYGDPSARTSWERFNGQFPAWSIEPAYKRLWNLYGGLVEGWMADPVSMVDLVGEFERVVMTAPLWTICRSNHDFPSREIWIKDGAPDCVKANEFVYNGEDGCDWYRASDLFGRRITEYVWDQEGAVYGEKVLPTDCSCWGPDVIRAGRWGEWKPGVLLDHAYHKVCDHLRPPRSGMINGREF